MKVHRRQEMELADAKAGCHFPGRRFVLCCVAVSLMLAVLAAPPIKAGPATLANACVSGATNAPSAEPAGLHSLALPRISSFSSSFREGTWAPAAGRRVHFLNGESVGILNFADNGDYDGRTIAAVEIVFEGSPADEAVQAEFMVMLRVAPNSEYSAVRIRDSLQALFDSGRVASARVEVTEVSGRKGPLRVRFIIQRQVIVADIRLEIGLATGAPIATDEIRARLNLIKPGARASKQSVLRNVDEIQGYLRDRGYFNAMVDSSQEVDAGGTRATVFYRITPGEAARVAAFNLDIKGFDPATVRPTLTLQPGAWFTRQALGEDVTRLRQAIIARGYLAPQIADPRVEREIEKNQMTITLTGAVGPKVNVAVENYKISDKLSRDLLPVKREGNIDQSAIVEGARRLRNKLQEDGYFFAEVTPVCKVTPPLPDLLANGTRETCETLNPDALGDHTVDITYQVEQGRRFTLKDIRITGTNKVTYDDVAAELKSQKANALGFIPYLGYGRGYTSLALLEQDKRTVAAHMREFGYRRSVVQVIQGVAINGEDLIITFKVTEGPLTRVAGVEIRGNKIYTEERLRRELRTIVGAPISRAIARVDVDSLHNLYAHDGYIDAEIAPSLVELPKKGEDEQVRIIYTIRNEGDKVFINRIIVNGVTGDAGTQQTKRNAIARASALAPGELLRSDRLNEAERTLYTTDAYSQVTIHTEPAGETSAGYKKRDVIIDVEEKKPRVVDYGGGYSTDTGPLGLFELSNVNLMNKLRQGAVRLRVSSRQQSLRLEYFDPRFARYGTNQFAPLSLSLQYRRDSTITRFFRSAIDRGTMGIVQRLDKKGNPIDQFGIKTGQPTINRFTFSIETQRGLNQKTRSIVFARYMYEDVRLLNLQSLVIKDILLPDRVVRLSRFGLSFARDTRERCEAGIPGSAEEASSHGGEVCRYNQLDPTQGDFLTADYSIAVRQLGGNISFSKFQSSYRRYYRLRGFRKTVLAGNMSLGLANVFNPRDRDGNGRIDEIDRTLPISERFYSGGATTLRGFNYEEAGPRQAVVTEGSFLTQNKKVVFLNPFTVPVGGNALAVLNLEARVPTTKELQIVPFYDGGNVFRRVGDLFGRHEKPDTTSTLTLINSLNLRTHWTHTVGLGFRIQTPLGGALAVDYGYLLNPPSFLVPQRGPSGASGDFDGTPAVFRLNRGQVQFRFTQTF
ncbi:MAG: outer membrane protein/protective antigen [Acidobacteria bacterium]|nr:outer membrane protein/protective antigen [Acidobacteriota bacterium]